MKIKVNIYDPYKSGRSIMEKLVGARDCRGNWYCGQLYYDGGDTTCKARNNIYNFTNAINIVDSYSFISSDRIVVTAGEENTHIIDNEFNYSFTLYGSEGIYIREALVEFWQDFLKKRQDENGEWKNDELINGKFVRGDIGEYEDEIVEK